MPRRIWPLVTAVILVGSLNVSTGREDPAGEPAQPSAPVDSPPGLQEQGAEAGEPQTGKSRSREIGWCGIGDRPNSRLAGPCTW